MAKDDPRLNLIIGNLTLATFRNPSENPSLIPIHHSKRVKYLSRVSLFLDFSI